jgi:hypothetical protein
LPEINSVASTRRRLYSLLWVVVFVLIVSFLSNVFPFFGASYTLLAALQLSLLGNTTYNFAVIVLISALGATLAKVVIYFGGFGLRDFLLRNKNVRLIGRYSSTGKFYVLLFVAALLPVFPFDDFIFIGAGAALASLGAMLSVTLLAKVIKSTVEVAVELAILKELANVFDFHRLDITIALSAAFVIIGIIVYRIDWEGVYGRFTGKTVTPVVTPAGTAGV